MRVAVDMALCQDHAQCCLVAAEVFGLDDTGRMAVLLLDPAPDLRAAVEEAEQVCPMQAIRVQG
jgi:ferredoxin